MTHNHRSVRQYSDQYHCSHCGKQWDVNDTDPPECTKVNKPDFNKLRDDLGLLKK